MKPSQWLDVIDIVMRILVMARQLLSQLWSGQGDGEVTEGDGC